MGPTPTTSDARSSRDRIRRHWGRFALLTVLGVTLVPDPLPGNAYLAGPPPAHTGGFAEATCHECHFDQPMDDPEGSLTLGGIPDTYTAGQSYQITITLTRPTMGRAGFQLAARLAGRERTGHQAGTLQGVDARVQVTTAEDAEDKDTDVQYAQHTVLGSDLSSRDTATWTIEWISPTTGGGVTFHVAANAANDDASEFGDFIYTQTRRAAPPR